MSSTTLTFRIPNEVLLIIVNNVHDTGTLRSLALVSRAAASFAQPKLFESIRLTHSRELSEALVALICNSSLLRHVRDLTVTVWAMVPQKIIPDILGLARAYGNRPQGGATDYASQLLFQTTRIFVSCARNLRRLEFEADVGSTFPTRIALELHTQFAWFAGSVMGEYEFPALMELALVGADLMDFVSAFGRLSAARPARWLSQGAGGVPGRVGEDAEEEAEGHRFDSEAKCYAANKGRVKKLTLVELHEGKEGALHHRLHASNYRNKVKNLVTFASGVAPTMLSLTYDRDVELERTSFCNTLSDLDLRQLDVTGGLSAAVRDLNSLQSISLYSVALSTRRKDKWASVFASLTKLPLLSYVVMEDLRYDDFTRRVPVLTSLGHYHAPSRQSHRCKGPNLQICETVFPLNQWTGPIIAPQADRYKTATESASRRGIKWAMCSDNERDIVAFRRLYSHIQKVSGEGPPSLSWIVCDHSDGKFPEKARRRYLGSFATTRMASSQPTCDYEDTEFKSRKESG